MERQIPHVLDVFTSSPGARRRMRASIVNKEKDDLQKNPGSDSAVSVGSSDEEEGEEQRNISMYFDYLNEDDLSGGGSSQRKKKKKKPSSSSAPGKENISKDNRNKTADDTNNKSSSASVVDKNEKNKQSNDKKERQSRKGEHEKDIRHIERHLSMKKTIRKKIMRDLQQAFVEDPKDFHQDPKYLSAEKKNNIDINNMTFSKNRLSKSEHNFLDMLKEDQTKERKGLRALIDFRKEKPAHGSVDSDQKGDPKATHQMKSLSKDTTSKLSDGSKHRSSQEEARVATEKIRDDDSGHGSPTRDNFAKRSKSKDDLLDMVDGKDGSCKKQSFWKRFTGKGKAKR